MNRKTKLSRWVAAALWLVAPAAYADAVDVSLNGRALMGQGLPTLNLHINEPIAGFEVKLTRSDGQPLNVRGGGTKGDTRQIELQQPEGKFGYKGELRVNFPDGSKSSMPLEFDAELFGPLRITVDRKDVDLNARRLAYRANRDIAKTKLKVQLDTGVMLVDTEIVHGKVPAGQPVEITWPEVPKNGRILKMAIQAQDESTFFTGVDVYPWQIDIPHEEVQFDTGKWAIRDDQRAKVDASFQAVADAVAKYGKLAPIKLYIAGHTDTVGTNASNRTLSLNRARSIGSYFKNRGLSIPVFYEGFGEEALLVGTPDNTDEQKNRRAEYILSIENPRLKQSPFPPSWQKL
jgi:outer membrane protein OmpA-like peptidoglycan-associated protein